MILAALVLSTVVLGACDIGYGRTVRGSGRVVEESRSVSGISRVGLATIGRLMIEVGDGESLRIQAEDNLMEYLETDVRAGTLRIESRQGVNLRTTRPVNYYLTVTGLDRVETSSSGDIVAPDLESDRFSIAISTAPVIWTWGTWRPTRSPWTSAAQVMRGWASYKQTDSKCGSPVREA